MSVQIHINGENAAEAVKELSNLAAHFMHVPVTSATISVDPAGAPMQAAQAQQPAAQQQNVAPLTPPPYHPEQAHQGVPLASAPTIPPMAPPPQAPIPVAAPIAAPPGTVPTTPQTYTIDQLAVAATQLLDAGRQPEVVNLLQQFGVQALMELPKEHYGAFATALRQMGAKL